MATRILRRMMELFSPAIGNTVYRATGKRIRDLPITLEKVLQH